MKRYKKIIIIVLSILIIFPLVHFCLSAIIYDGIFNERYETVAPYNYTIDEFSDLHRKQYNFNSNENQKLVGYLYYYDEILNPIGLVFVAHGMGGGGHKSYMECIYYFTKNNFLVFSYDATGNDESEGKGIEGLPQQLIDLDYALNFVNDNLDEINDLPIMLFGHSWGGYAVTNILNFHNDISAVVSISGFNSSKDIIKIHAKKYVGFIADLLLPSVYFYEKIKFGKYAKVSALSGFEKCDTNVMVIHSQDDEVVPIECGYDLYYDKYKDNTRFNFIKIKDKGHNHVFHSDDAIKEIDNINMKFNEWLKTLDYDYTKKKNINRFIEDKRNYLLQLDRNILCNLINEELFDNIIDFYENSIK